MPGRSLDARDSVTSQARSVPACMGLRVRQGSPVSITKLHIGEITAEAGRGGTMMQYKNGVCEWGGHLAKMVREGLPKEVAIELCLQNEQVKEEKEECTACAKALWWEGTRRIQGPEGRWMKVSRLREVAGDVGGVRVPGTLKVTWRR